MQPITSKAQINYCFSEKSEMLAPMGLKQDPLQAAKQQCRQIKSPYGMKMKFQPYVDDDSEDEVEDEDFQIVPIHFKLKSTQFNKLDTFCRFNYPLLLYRGCIKYPQHCIHNIFTITKQFQKRKCNLGISDSNYNLQQVAKYVYASKLENWFEYLQMNNSISEIDIQFLNRQFKNESPADLSKIFRRIYKCKKLILDLYENLLSYQDFSKLGHALSNFLNLEYLDLDLACNAATFDGLAPLTKGLSKCRKIKIFKINFDESGLNDEAIVEVNRFIKEEVPLLETFKFRSSWNYFSQGVMQSLGPALAKKEKLKELEFINEFGPINYQTLEAILEGLAQCENFNSLKLSPSVILENKEQFESIGKAIGKFTRLRELFFSNESLRNKFTTVENRNFFASLSSLTELRILGLTIQNVKIADSAFDVLCQAIKGFKYLTKLELNMSNTEIGYDSIRGLGDTLKECQIFQKISLILQKTHLSEEILKEFSDKLKGLENFDTIYLDIRSAQGIIVEQEEDDEKRFEYLFPYVKNRIIKSKEDLPDYD